MSATDEQIARLVVDFAQATSTKHPRLWRLCTAQLAGIEVPGSVRAARRAAQPAELEPATAGEIRAQAAPVA